VNWLQGDNEEQTSVSRCPRERGHAAQIPGADCRGSNRIFDYPAQSVVRLGLRSSQRQLLFVGDRGKILCSFNGGNPKLIPQSKMDSYKQPPKTLPRSPGNEREWLDACKGGKVKPGGNFEFEGMVTETLLLGNVASRMGQKLTWDRSSLKVNSDVAQKYVQPERRKGWEL
jgi:hypothetical protein